VDQSELAHLLRRTEYVAKPARISALVGGTREQAVDDILNVTVPVSLPAYLQTDIEGEGYDQFVYAIQWWIDRMVDSTKPMLERMAFFWHGHFCSGWDKVGSTWAMMQQNKLFRDQAFGNFRGLTHAMSIQTAMLLYLDNIDNVKSSPNQNFARELMELFTIGIGNYTEDDVTAAARAWTGHGINWNTYQYQFRSWDHDTGMKTFMGQTRNWDGPDIINFLLQENLTMKLTTCKFLTKKLWEHFAYQNPSQVLIDEIAQVLYDNDFAIKPWVKAMLMHDEFYSAQAVNNLVRSPVEYVVNCMWFTGLRSQHLNPQWSVEGMGQVPFVPPNVAGWKTNAYWVNTSLFGARAEFARGITWRLRSSEPQWAAYRYDPSAGTLGNPQQAVTNVANKFGLNLAAPTSAALRAYVDDERAGISWIDWWEPTNLLTMAMMTPEFHVA